MIDSVVPGLLILLAALASYLTYKVLTLNRKINALTQKTTADLAALRRRSEAAYLGDHTALTRLHSGQKIYVDTRDVSIAPHLLLDGRWETWIEDVLMPLVKPGMRVLDVGANVGYYTLRMADAVGPLGHVFAFEANPSLFRLLQKSVSVNGYDDRVRLHCNAAFDAAGEVTLAVDPAFSGGGHLTSGVAAQVREEVHTVPAVTIDSMIPPGVTIDIAKIDVEGAEVQALGGMQRILAESRSIALVFEFDTDRVARAVDPRQFLERLAADGFTLASLEHQGPSGPLSPAQVLERIRGRVGYLLARR